MIAMWRELGFSSSPDCSECDAKEYQCLWCKGKWESHTSPANWKYCPNCGVLWQNPGELVCQKKHRPRPRPREIRPEWIISYHIPSRNLWLETNRFNRSAIDAYQIFKNHSKWKNHVLEITIALTKPLPLP